MGEYPLQLGSCLLFGVVPAVEVSDQPGDGGHLVAGELETASDLPQRPVGLPLSTRFVN